MTLLNALRDFCTRYGHNKHYFIALSGGLDSCVLLSLFQQLRTEQQINVSAIHVNHQLSPQAHFWSAHCRDRCAAYDIDYIERVITVQRRAGDSLEEMARIQRYAIFSEYMHENAILLTAHQQDDQAETVILQLLRGAGPKGLSAMPVIKPFARGQHGRPLLSFSRETLHAYADEQQLKWINDESNENQTFTRNFLRLQILPLLKSRWPSAAAVISRGAAHCAEANGLLEEFAHDLCVQVSGSQANTLSVSKLLQLSSEKQKLLLRTWIYQSGFPIPDTRKIETIQRDVLLAAWDRSPCVSWGEVELRRHRDDLHLMHALPMTQPNQSLLWDIQQPLLMPGIGTLQTALVKGRGLRTDIQQVTVTFRQGGETVALAQRGRLSLKNLFQEWGVLPWERDTLPLIFVADKLVAAVGYFLDDAYAAKEDALGQDIIFTKSY